MLEQAWDGIAVAMKVLALSIAALVLTIIVPGLGLVLGWMIASYAIGRGLFVAVAMRRMPRLMAESLYFQSRGIVLAQGGILALAAYIPMLNLLIPVIGVAAMVHILDMALATAHEIRPLMGSLSYGYKITKTECCFRAHSMVGGGSFFSLVKCLVQTSQT